MNVKICGIKDKVTLKYISAHPHPPKFIGMILNYSKSPRFVSLKKAKELTKIKSPCKYVAVLVAPTIKFLNSIKNINFEYWQIYNLEPEKIKFIKKKYKKKVIVAITIKNKIDVEAYKLYKGFSNIILFDSKGFEKSKSFNHSFLKSVPNSIKKMIAGNIKTKDIYNFKNSPYILDVSGALETKKGIKDMNKIDKFLNTVHNINS
tara:strand:+ start:810 stop:1424 length:615 start_codon:yes stop_codon:yes gene_type:complete